MLSKSYNKSASNRKRTLRQILKETKVKPKEAIGLSEVTINRNLDYFGQIFAKARSEGFTTMASLNLAGLRMQQRKRERDQRDAYSRPDIEAIFNREHWQKLGLQPKRGSTGRILTTHARGLDQGNAPRQPASPPPPR